MENRKDEVATALGERLRHQRRKHRQRQGEVAKLFGVAQQTLSAWETGRRLPGSPEQIEAVADYLDLPRNELTVQIAGVRDALTDDERELILDELILVREALAHLVERVGSMFDKVEQTVREQREDATSGRRTHR